MTHFKYQIWPSRIKQSFGAPCRSIEESDEFLTWLMRRLIPGFNTNLQYYRGCEAYHHRLANSLLPIRENHECKEPFESSWIQTDKWMHYKKLGRREVANTKSEVSPIMHDHLSLYMRASLGLGLTKATALVPRLVVSIFQAKVARW